MPHPIKPTSAHCQSAWQPNPGRRSTYRRGESVQTTGTSSLCSSASIDVAESLERRRSGTLPKGLERERHSLVIRLEIHPNTHELIGGCSDEERQNDQAHSTSRCGKSPSPRSDNDGERGNIFD